MHLKISKKIGRDGAEIKRHKKRYFEKTIAIFVMPLIKYYKTFMFQCKDACAVCSYCGGFQRLLCPICHGSKRSVHRNEFTVEFVALKCAKCDVFGMIRCPHC